MAAIRTWAQQQRKKRRECSCIDGGDDAQDMRDCPCLQDVCGARYKREGGFATLGGPDLLTLVSEVASRALKVVWRQKWLVHRRSRPEALAGYLHIQTIGTDTGATTPFGISEDISKSIAGQKIYAANKGGYFLPMAFSAGSPNHPAYGAGHATVAGACVTILKAWFDEEACLSALLPTESCSGASGRPEAPKPAKEPFDFLSLREPGPCKGADEFEDPQAYCGADRHKLTVGGELNKLASNVAMGRSIGGVHWRSDNTRSLRLGEQIAIEILRKRTHEYAEAGASFSFTSFDGHKVTI